MQAPDLEQLEQATEEIYPYMSPSSQLQWPLLSERCGCRVWVKHENHNPTGAFKVRGGLLYIGRLVRREPNVKGVVTATRGNHGLSIAFAAARHNLPCVVVVPEGNNPEKNLAIKALGAELVIHGRDFDEAIPHSHALADRHGFHRLPSFHEDLVCGVASYSMEFLKARPELERVYVSIGLGSGVCGMICARNALGMNTEIIGVSADGADCYARSFAAGRCVSTPSADTLADGMAVREPNPEALALMLDNLARVVTVTESEIMQAMAHYFTDTHNVAEGAGAAPLAALLHEGAPSPEAAIGLVLSGGNAERTLYGQVLGGYTAGTRR
jgi:threonine dehydratase